jgi:cell cycle checkpoint protein
LEEEGVLTDCSIRTLNLEDLMSFELSADSAINKVIIRADPMKDIFSALDPTTEMLELLLSPEEPYIRLTTIGTTGECQVSILSLF